MIVTLSVAMLVSSMIKAREKEEQVKRLVSSVSFSTGNVDVQHSTTGGYQVTLLGDLGQQAFATHSGGN